jgi:tRNA(Ile)-lysidine synthase
MQKTIEQRVLKFIDENHLIEKNDKVLVALSGGADSVFLLHFFLKFKKRLGIEISAFHLNHNLRGKDALDDEKFCKALCEEKNAELFIISEDVKSFAKQHKLSLEEAGRALRYKHLNEIASKNAFTKIATAHNAGDNAETVMLNLIKGAGLRGLSGIPIRRDKIIRPIINLNAKEIRYYLNKMKITYRLDRSNLESDYERNFLRNEIFPRLKKKLNPRLEQKILSSSMIIRELRSFIEKQILLMEKAAVKFSNGELRINLKKLRRFDSGLWKEFLKTSVEKKTGIDLSGSNLNALIKLTSNQTGKKVLLPKKYAAFKDRNILLIKPVKPGLEKSSKKIIRVNEEVNLNDHKLRIGLVNNAEVKKTQNKSVEYISADNLSSTFQLRKWKAGDRFFPLGMKGSKKISDFLTDEKIPPGRKKDQLVLTNSGKIVWVLNLRIDDRFKITPDTKKVIKLSYR